MEKEPKEEVVAPATLSSIIHSLHELLDTARNIIVRYQNRSNDIDIREKNVLTREVNVDNKEQNFTKREELCKKVEDIKVLEDQANALMDASNLRLQAAVEAERSLSIATQEATEKITSDRLIAQREANNVLEQRKSLDDEVSKRVKQVLINMGITPKE